MKRRHLTGLLLSTGLALGLVLLCFSLLSGRSDSVRAASLADEQAVTVRYVATSGTDNGNCSNATTPCRSLQYAVDQAREGDEVRMATGVYTGVLERSGVVQIAMITRSLTLRGGYAPGFASRDITVYSTTLDAESQGRVLYISAPGAALTQTLRITLDGLRLVRGLWGAREKISVSIVNDWWNAAAGGGMRVFNTCLTLQDVALLNNHTPNGIGTGLMHWSGALTMTHSTVQGNTPNSNYMPLRGGFGGGLFLLQVNARIQDSAFLNNTAANNFSDTDEGTGGGVYLNRSTAVIDHVTFAGNAASAGRDGDGGALHIDSGRLSVTNSTFRGNSAAMTTYGRGGAVRSHVPTLLENNLFEDNYAVGSASAAGEHGFGGALFTMGGPFTVTHNIFRRNTGCVGVACSGGAIQVYGGQALIAENSLISNTTAGGGGGIVSDGGDIVIRDNLFQNNHAGDGGGGYWSGCITTLRNIFVDNRADNNGGGVFHVGDRNTGCSKIQDGNSFLRNTAINGGGLYISSYSIGPYWNPLFLDNAARGSGSSLYMSRSETGVQAVLHATLARNAGTGEAVVLNQGSLALTNAIIYSATVGARNTGGTLEMEHVLRHQVITPTQGIVSDLFASSGDPLFAADGYHLTQNSPAVDGGQDAGVTDDVDADIRPQGNAPDLGADESPYTKGSGGTGLQATKTAGTPHWAVYYTGINVPPSTIFEQDYLLSFQYGAPITAPAITSYQLKDNFPASLNLVKSSSQPALAYSHNGNTHTWTSQASTQPGGWGWVGLVGRSNSVQPGATLQNTGQMLYTSGIGKAYTVSLQASTQVPLRPVFPPLLLSPKNGEMCVDETGQLQATGLAGAGMLVRLYENTTPKVETIANASGLYTLTWTTALDTSTDVSLYTVACDPDTPSNCSAPSSTIYLDYPEAFWCPQRSYWEGNVGSTHLIFYFRNERGAYATNDFVIPGMHGFVGTQLHLYSCCDRETNPFKVIADDVTYETPSAHDGRWWTFTIGSAHYVTVQSQCQVGGSGSHGRVLIDPDGFVFNATRGGSYSSETGMFVPNQPIPGITVTAYVSVPEWGGWIPWPAQLYNNQVNPQVTGDNGYFAFFTPPGHYYLQADSQGGYQGWRSPLIEVVTQVVHMNIPITPWSDPAVSRVQLTSSGPDQPALNLAIGGTVEWTSAASTGLTADALAALLRNPLVRVLSDLDPLLTGNGWDSGMLAPGTIYRHTFRTPGTYLYTDGSGHTGQVTVSGLIYLPMVSKR